MCEGCNSAKNGALDASVAAHIAENGSNRVFLRFFLMNALVCMQAKKRRLHAVPRCGSDRLNLHFREGSVAGISRWCYGASGSFAVRDNSSVKNVKFILF